MSKVGTSTSSRQIGGVPSRLDLAAINRERVIVQQLLIQVGGQGRVGDAVSLAKLRPGLKMLVIDLLSHSLHVQLSHVGNHRAEEAGLDSEDALQKIVDGALACCPDVSCLLIALNVLCCVSYSCRPCRPS